MGGEARPDTLADAVTAFLRTSVNGRLGQAGRLLGEHPEIVGYDVRTAIVLGDAPGVERALGREPDLVTRRDPETGWTAIHLACASRWHADPARAAGLATVVARLLDAGADLHRPPTADSQWTPLRCAVASAGSGRGNEPIVTLLLERGAQVFDHDLYLGGFATGGGAWCVRRLLAHTPDPRATAAQALAAPVSLDDAEGVRVLLDAGADPTRYRDDDGTPADATVAAIAAGCHPELIELLLAHGADPNGRGADGRSAYADAVAHGRADLATLLERYGASDDATALDRLQYACLRGDRAGALGLRAERPELAEALAGADGTALADAAEAGDRAALELLLELGFPVAAAKGADGATALHVAAWAGSAELIEPLLAAGAPLEAEDATWHATPLRWALVGSRERGGGHPSPDWVETVRRLLDAGANADAITLEPADPTEASPEVLELLRERRGLGA